MPSIAKRTVLSKDRIEQSGLQGFVYQGLTNKKSKAVCSPAFTLRPSIDFLRFLDKPCNQGRYFISRLTAYPHLLSNWILV